jgi:hypothetical protein
MSHAEGSFDVSLKFETYDDAPGAALARATGEKTFRGDLEATSHLEMLSARNARSGAYVAIERITGKLGGKTGTFVVHHLGVGERGVQSLDIRVVPDSGTGELVGLRGSMTIDIRDGKHFYRMEYDLG